MTRSLVNAPGGYVLVTLTGSERFVPFVRVRARASERERKREREREREKEREMLR